MYQEGAICQVGSGELDTMAAARPDGLSIKFVIISLTGKFKHGIQNMIWFHPFSPLTGFIFTLWICFYTELDENLSGLIQFQLDRK